MNAKLSATILITALLAGSYAFAKSNTQTVSINAGDTLYVRIIDLLPDQLYHSSRTSSRLINEYDRYLYLKESISQVFEKAELPVKTVYLRLGAKVPKDAVVLDVSLHDWRLHRLGEYETRIAAQLRAPEGKENLGIEIGRIYALGGVDTWILENFQESARQAVAKLIPEIAQRIVTTG